MNKVIAHKSLSVYMSIMKSFKPFIFRPATKVYFFFISSNMAPCDYFRNASREFPCIPPPPSQQPPPDKSQIKGVHLKT